ncbi:MAG: CUAEP/CCAEP-tail radical SAM protein [Chloroflexi bacterium]|nr:CUAEP/CCAEP-tail radical SAM protein [Chloroflexota bacterium]
MRIFLASTYELGHQPLGLASPAAALRAAGHEVRCLDLAVERLPGAALTEAELVGISVPMHTAARLGLALAARVRALNPGAHIVLYGLYASSLHTQLLGRGVVDSVVGGEYEPGLVRLAGALAAGETAAEGIDGVGADPSFARGAQIVPDRRGLPPLHRYARLSLAPGGGEGSHEGDLRLAGYVEASRGCAHLCRHCPITPIYGGRLRVAAMETALADIDQLVAMGARHITFGDPDFFNAVPRSLAITEEMRRRHADVTFDATVKVEHLLEHADLLPRLRELGGLFLTSAFESTNDAVLARLDKGHTRADMERALTLVRDTGLALRPTWLPFTPWATAEDFLELLEFVERWGLVESVQPVQLALRLLVPPGSVLVEALEADGLLGEYDEDGLTYTWRGVDPRTETLQAEVAAIVESAAHEHGRRQSTLATFAAVKRAAYRAVTGVDGAMEVVSQPSAVVPGLTEAWFC